MQDGFRRGLFSTLVVALTWGLTVGIIGFASANDEAVEGVPESLQLASPRMGDRFQYHVSEMTVGAGGLPLMGPRTPLVEFEWGDPRDVLDQQGLPHRVNVLQARHLSEAQGEMVPIRNVTYFLDATTGGLVARSVSGVSLMESGQPDALIPEDELKVMDSSWATVFALGQEDRERVPCGVLNALQARSVRLDRDVFPVGPCMANLRAWDDPAAKGVGSLAFRAVGMQTIGEAEAIVLSNVEGVHLWLAAESPYPLRIAVPVGPGQFEVVGLGAYEPGRSALASGEVPAASPAPSLAWAPREVWGPSEASLQRYFPLSEAFAYARDDPGASRLREFLRENPTAYVEYADHRSVSEMRDEGYWSFRTWHFVVTNGADRIPIGLTQVDRPEDGPIDDPVGILPSMSMGGSRSHEYHNTTTLDYPPVAPELAPASMPTVHSVIERRNAYLTPGFEDLGGVSWGFRIFCSTDPCDRATFVMNAGSSGEYYHRHEQRYTLGWIWWYWGQSKLHVDDQGRPLWLDEFASEAERQSSVFSPLSPGPEPGDAEPLEASSFDTRPWAFPQAPYVVAAGAVAALTGLAYWVWPTLKNGLLAPLFSRIVQPRALNHSSRAILAQLIEAEPGIHFQEIVRRSGLGVGPVRHHLGKLVHVGLVTEQAGQGYHCFFLRGQVDRRLMRAAPVLKAPGARAILQAVSAHSGASSLAVAQATGLDPGTVSYHVRKLAQASLVTAERAGRELRLTLTEVGQMAIRAQPAT